MITDFGPLRVFMPRFMWHISQPIVVGTLTDIIAHVINERSGEHQRQLEGIYELPEAKKVTKKDLKVMINAVCPELHDKCKELHII